MPRRCVANLDSITTIPQRTLDRLVTSLSPQKLEQVEDAVHFALSLES
jgi:mRNA-degrading endonuclease toxin of MazEF toxin-antitoxin module